MSFVAGAFDRLFHSRSYIATFYGLTALLFTCGAAYLEARGVREQTIAWVACALVLPMHFGYYAILHSVKRLRPGFIAAVLRPQVRRLAQGSSSSGLRRIMLLADYAALASAFIVLGSAASSVVAYLFVRVACADGFPSGLYALIITIELCFMLCVVFVPFVMRWFWLPERVRLYEEEVCRRTYPILVRVAAAEGIALVTSSGASKRTAIGSRTVSC